MSASENEAALNEGGVSPHYRARAQASRFLRTESLRGKSSARWVDALEAAMKSEGWSGEPIAVVQYGEELYIVDGHHRVYAARRANILVEYRVLSASELLKFGYRTLDEVVIAHAEAGPNRLPPRHH